jgi:hypothetical protein
MVKATILNVTASRSTSNILTPDLFHKNLPVSSKVHEGRADTKTGK